MEISNSVSSPPSFEPVAPAAPPPAPEAPAFEAPAAPAGFSAESSFAPAGAAESSPLAGPEQFGPPMPATSPLAGPEQFGPAIPPGFEARSAPVGFSGESSFTPVSAAATNPNSILGQYTPTGASAATARQDGLQPGLEASRQMAMRDLPNLQRHQANIESVANQYGVPPALVAAIISRESRGGSALDGTGRGDHGHGFGLMQVDDRTAAPRGGPMSREHIEHGVQIFQGKLNEVRAAHPEWTPDQQLRGAVAAYNMGARNVQTLEGMDRGSTGNDYSSDVWARAQALAPHFGGATTPAAAAGPQLNPGAPGAARVGQAPDAGAPMLREGARGPAVRDLQQQLRAAGFNPGPIDGKFGPRTERAVNAFQQARGLAVDGIVGPQTRGALGQVPGRPTAPGAAARPPLPPARPTAPAAGAPAAPTTGGADPARPTQAGGVNGAARLNAYPNGRGMTTGTITVNGNTYQFNSGSRSLYSVPQGEFRVTTHRNNRSEAAFSRDGVGYSFRLEDPRRPGSDAFYDPRAGRDRTALRIHPDGGATGTAGCIGILGNAETQRRFRDDLNAEIRRNGGSYTLRVQ